MGFYREVITRRAIPGIEYQSIKIVGDRIIFKYVFASEEEYEKAFMFEDPREIKVDSVRGYLDHLNKVQEVERSFFDSLELNN